MNQGYSGNLLEKKGDNVIKTYKKDNVETVQKILDFTNYCAEKGFCNFATLKHNNDGTCQIIYKFIEGHIKEVSMLNAKDYITLGDFLGDFHRKVNDYPKGRLINKIKNIELTKVVKDLNNLKENLYTNEYKKIFMLNKEKIVAVQNILFTKDVIHGDMHLNNIIQSENKLFLIDYDQASSFPRIYEVMRFFFESINISQDTKENIFQNLLIYLKSYNVLQHFSIKEKQWMISFYFSILLKDYSVYETDNVQFQTKRLIRMKFISTHFDTLNKIVSLI
ncbi:phosphotransferase [Bacillus toyonensis]|uniref:phosphotransferase n=1 Tax=Bacillus TaxID=1386 RepID=UPI001F0A525F|nr:MULTISPECIES: phosphotransferase [Bacillus]